MKDDKSQSKTKTFSPDWLVQGVLTKLGDTFDRLTGRSWNPSSSLATSKLVEKLKVLLDSKAKDLGEDGVFVPHNIKLMIQWDKFSTDSEEDLVSLEHELHTATIDHINDRLYHTYAQINIEVKTDYFTEGVRLLGNFGKFSETEEDEASINVTLPNLRRDDIIPNKTSIILNANEIAQEQSTFKIKFHAAEKIHDQEIDFTKKKRIIVGRAKENDIVINDRSVSKIHASIVLNAEKQLLVADTGSTNGTFVGTERIIYGKAFEIEEGTSVKFGVVEVSFKRLGSLESSNVSNNMSAAAEILPTVADIEFVAEKMEAKEESFGNENEVALGKAVEKNDEKNSVEFEVSENDDFSDTDLSERESEAISQDYDIASDTNETQDWEV